MIATIEFNLDEEDDYRSHSLMLNAEKYKNVIWNFDQWIRGKVKYPPEDIPDGAHKAYAETREKLWEFLSDRGIDLDD